MTAIPYAGMPDSRIQCTGGIYTMICLIVVDLFGGFFTWHKTKRQTNRLKANQFYFANLRFLCFCVFFFGFLFPNSSFHCLSLAIVLPQWNLIRLLRQRTDQQRTHVLTPSPYLIAFKLGSLAAELILWHNDQDVLAGLYYNTSGVVKVVTHCHSIHQRKRIMH